MISREISNPKKLRTKFNSSKQINYLVEREARLHSILEGKKGDQPLTEDRKQQIACKLKNLQKEKQSLKG